VPVRLGIHAFRIKSKVIREGVNKGPLVGRHRFEPEAFLGWVGSENTELFLLSRSPRYVFLIHCERLRGIWNVVILMSCGIDVESQGEFAIPFQTSAFIITLQELFGISFTIP
jgi:hypothetical protein